MAPPQSGTRGYATEPKGNEAILEAMTPGQAPEAEGHAGEQYKPEPNGTAGLVFTETVGPFTILEGNPVRGEDGTGEVDRLMWEIFYPSEGA